SSNARSSSRSEPRTSTPRSALALADQRSRGVVAQLVRSSASYRSSMNVSIAGRRTPVMDSLSAILASGKTGSGKQDGQMERQWFTVVGLVFDMIERETTLPGTGGAASSMLYCVLGRASPAISCTAKREDR